MKAVALVACSGQQISQSFPLLEPHKQQSLAGKSAICMHQHLKFTQQQLHNLSGQAFGESILVLQRKDTWEGAIDAELASASRIPCRVTGTWLSKMTISLEEWGNI